MKFSIALATGLRLDAFRRRVRSSVIANRSDISNRTNLLFVAVVAFLFASHSFGQDSSPAAIEQYRAAVALQNQQLYDLAAEEWQVFTKEFKDDPYIGNAQHYLGVCYFQTEAYAKADRAFDAALAANAKFHPKGKVATSTTLLNQGLARFNLGQTNGQDAKKADDKRQLEKAITTLNRLQSEFGGSKEAAEGNYYLAESLFAVGRKGEATRIYEQTVNDSPKHPQREKLLYALGVAYQEAGQTDQARAIFEKLRAEFPQSEFGDEIATRRGDTLFAAKKFGEAARAFASVAAKSDSEFADYALLQQAAAVFQQKKYAEAGKLYASVVERFPESEYVSAATLSAGKCLHLGNAPGAEEWLTTATRLKIIGRDNSALEAAHWLARLQIKNNKAAEALGPLEQSIQAADKNKTTRKMLPQLRLDLADALYEIEERRPEAARLYQTVADEYADNEVAPQARYMAAFATLNQKDYEAAGDQAQQFLNKWPQSDLRADILAIDAESHLQSGQHDLAGKRFEELISQFTSRPERESWISRRAICFNRDKKHDEVIRWLNAHMGDIRNEEIKAESQFLLGSAYLTKGNEEQAISLLGQSLETASHGIQSDRALLLLGEAHQAAKNPKQALAAIRRLLQEHPNSQVAGQARFREAELLYAQDNFEDASVAYHQVLQGKPSDLHPSALFGLAWSQLSLEDYDAATATLNRLATQHGDHELSKKAGYAMGVAYQQKQEFDKAIAALNVYLKGKLSKSDKADALYLRGLCLVGKGDLKKATTDFQAVTKTNPKHPEAEQVLYEMAWAYQDADQGDKAAKAFRQLAEDFPQGSLAAEAWYRVAEYEYQQKKFGESTQSYQHSLENAKDQPEIRERAIHKLGWAHYQQKKYPAAERAFQEQIDATKDGELAPTARLMAAECAYQQKEYERALDGFQLALTNNNKGDNRTSDSLRSLSLLHAGQAAAQRKQWQISADLLRQCVDEFPDSDSIHQTRYELAFALQNLGKTEQAQPLFEQIATETNSPVGARARFMLGELQFANDDYNGAIRTFAKVFAGYGGDKAPKSYHQWQADSLFEAARCCESTKRFDSAKRFYQQLIDRYPKSDKINAARGKLKVLGE